MTRPSKIHFYSTPLMQGDGIIGQLFGNYANDDGPLALEQQVMVKKKGYLGHGLWMHSKACGRRPRTTRRATGTRSAIGSEEALDTYLACGCITLTAEVCPDGCLTH